MADRRVTAWRRRELLIGADHWRSEVARDHGPIVDLGPGRESAQLRAEIFRRDGATVSWLALWPRDDADQPARWTKASRLFSPAATVALISIATRLMRSLWSRGRAEHLGEQCQDLFRPPPPDQLFGRLGVRHHVLADWYQPLRYAAEEQELVVQLFHFDAPQRRDGDEESES